MEENKPELAAVADALGGGAVAESKDAKLDQDRAAFDALQKKYAKKDDEPKKPVVEKKQPEVEDSGEDAPPAEAKGKPETPESTRAREFLRLKASVPASVIEKLSPEEAQDWATSSSKNVADVDRAFMERAELQKELRELREAASESEEPSSAVPASEMDLDEVESQLSEQFGESESKALTGALRDILSPFTARIAQLEAVIDQAKNSNTRQIATTNRERLSELVPLLAESNRAWAAVEREVIASAEMDPGAFTNAAEFFDDAVKALYGETVFDKKPEPEPEEEAVDEGKEARELATPTTKTRKPAPRKLPAKESDWEVFKHLGRNPGDIRGAQRAGRVKSA
jgi:hypothetical protein